MPARRMYRKKRTYRPKKKVDKKTKQSNCQVKKGFVWKSKHRRDTGRPGRTKDN
eukprot:COSAG02_NODE_71729_length_189_cov_3752.044444_1_plen_53_part_10